MNNALLITEKYDTRLDMEEVITETVEKLKGIANMALVILPDKNLPRYKKAKRVFTTKFSMGTQCFQGRHIGSKNFSWMDQKLIIQLNAKLGRAPWSLE